MRFKHPRATCRRNMRVHWKRRIADATQVRVRPSSQHARTLGGQNRRCIASARATVIVICAHIASVGSRMHRNCASVIAACTHTRSGESPMHRNCARDFHRAHMASAESPMHRNCACDRHRNMRAQCKRRVIDAAEVRVRPSSQHARTMQAVGRRCIASARAAVITTCGHNASGGLPMHRKCACDCHRDMRAHCKRCVTDAAEVRVRPSLQRAQCKR